jgi:hypothetical protein
MEQLIINNIKDFSNLIIELKFEELCPQIIKVYNDALGGCNCNKRSREIYAKAIYVSFLKNPYNDNLFKKIKVEKNLNKIVFKLDENILKEI